jgi:HSP20 family protein
MFRDKVRFPHILFLPAARHPGPSGWRPRADIYRTPEGWFVKFELAGVCPDDVRLAVRGQTLFLEGSRRDECPHLGSHCYHLEITYSRFERAVDLPGLSERAQMTARYRDGMLLVEIVTEGRP